MKSKEFASYGSNIIAMIFTAVQPDEILQYVSLGLTIIATLFSIGFTIYNWYSKASKDGKITKEEVDELVNDLKDDIKKDKEE